MEGFILKGEQGYLQLHLDEVYGFPEQTSHFGGYDAEGTLEIKSNNYFVRGKLWFTTGEVCSFYEQLGRAYDLFSGEATFSSSEVNLEFKITFDSRGHAVFKGYFKELHHLDNELKFEIESDQSYFESTLADLKKFVQKYGGLKGVK
ncbi:WapI family immunity protein [Aneurinibacillus tyrosinisolvens]|uniref:WapI family immunity protein n=1 Tax=Aneurinibacillus tyrosinisolvens TaxID=1443435 RepID=UPI00063EDCED|nr:hypothetical protein [Aneurinibacillus tyrosinisolvens]